MLERERACSSAAVQAFRTAMGRAFAVTTRVIEFQVLPTDIRPEHGLGVLEGSPSRFDPQRAVGQKTKRRVGQGCAVRKGTSKPRPLASTSSAYR